MVVVTPSGRQYRLLRDYRLLINGVRVIVPAGFEFDGASIPRILWRIWTPFSPLSLEAALGHDWMYRSRTKPCTRAQADAWFLAKLRESGAPLATLMWVGVRLGGWLWWKHP